MGFCSGLFFFFFFGLWFDLGETVLQRDIRGAVSCHGSHQCLLLVKRGEADGVCVCVCVCDGFEDILSASVPKHSLK